MGKLESGRAANPSSSSDGVTASPGHAGSLSSCHHAIASSRQPVTVAFVGNPNTGKTTLFNALAGLRHRVGNYPGVTVEIKKGRLTTEGATFEVVDLPGTYSLAARSPDEMLAVDLILGREGEHGADVVVCVVDASNLERNLYLTTQVLELGRPVVIALNMIDVADRHGVKIDPVQLAKRLSVPVVPIQANKGRGMADLRRAIKDASNAGAPVVFPVFPEVFESEVSLLSGSLNGVSRVLIRRLLLDVGGYTESRLIPRSSGLGAELSAARRRLAAAGCNVREIEARTRYAWIRHATKDCVTRPAKRSTSGSDRLDRVLTHRVWGSIVFLLLMFVVFQSIFTWARPLMDLIDGGRETIGIIVGDSLSPGPLRGLLVDGIVKGVGSVLVFLPQILILFAFIAVLEDCGYMARAAFLMDRVMASCGLSGKSFIPMLSSVACAVPGIMATRVIEDRRDRLTTILVAPLMSCSARLPVYVLLIGAFLTAGYAWWLPGVVMFCMYGLGFVLAPLVALLLKRTILHGETPIFIMEMPVYKWPSLGTVLRRVTDSAWAFLKRAGTLILATMILVWALLYFPHRNAAGQGYDTLIAELEESIEQPTQEIESLKQQGAGLAAAARAAELQETIEAVQREINRVKAEWKGQSLLGHMGKSLEPVVAPLGWDWRIGMATLASFPAREVVVGTLGLIYQADEPDPKEDLPPGETRLGQALQNATWDGQPNRKVFTVPVVLSLMVFFALCCQCVSTLAVIRRETNTWRWPLFTFMYMTVLAYAGAWVAYQVGSSLA